MDHKKSIMLGYIAGEAEPGIDWVNGEFENDKEGRALFLGQHSALLEEMQRLQMVWFKALVRLADDDWNRYHLHRFVTALQRTAALTLNLVDKEWMLETEIEQALSKCKFCFTNVHPQATICFSCHADLSKDIYVNATANQLTAK